MQFLQPSSARAYQQFGLVLVMNHACNLRCDYCYTGTKYPRAMPETIGRIAIERAVHSIAEGRALELGFFGGEPLLESSLIRRLLEYGRRLCGDKIELRPSLTTNGTIASGDAWIVLAESGVDVAISHDGLPDAHDRHRRDVSGRGSSAAVETTIGRLIEAGREARTVTVVRPDTLADLPAGMIHLRELGVLRIDLSLDLWTRWSADDLQALRKAIALLARLWLDWLPDGIGINWFDQKAAELLRLRDSRGTARCGFGAGEVAVAPSGNLYPCERLVGEDRLDNRWRLPGHATDGGADFLPTSGLLTSPERSDDACDRCAMTSMCDTICRCSNYVRTGDVRHPDALLCAWNQACLEHTARALRSSRIRLGDPAALSERVMVEANHE